MNILIFSTSKYPERFANAIQTREMFNALSKQLLVKNCYFAHRGELSSVHSFSHNEYLYNYEPALYPFFKKLVAKL